MVILLSNNHMDVETWVTSLSTILVTDWIIDCRRNRLARWKVKVVKGEILYGNVIAFEFVWWNSNLMLWDVWHIIGHAAECAELLASLDAKTDEFPSQEDLSGAAVALLRLQDTYALSTNHLAGGNVQGISDSMSMSGMVFNICSVCDISKYHYDSNLQLLSAAF